MSNKKEGVFEMPVMSIKDLKDFAQRFEKYQIQKDSHTQNNTVTTESKTNDVSDEVIEVNGSQWKSIEVNGSQWKSMEVNGSQWKSMEVNGSQWKSMEVNGSQVRVGTTQHINAMLGGKTRKNSKQFLLNSTHTDLFSEDFVSTPDSVFQSEQEKPEENEVKQTNSIYSSFNDIDVTENEKYLQLKVVDKDDNVFGINLPVIDEGRSLIALNVCNVENISSASD